MSLFSTSAHIESNDDFHLSRLLLLVETFAGLHGDDMIEGITKLAKLDFLLRYPLYLERALRARDAKPGAAEVPEFEKTTVESTMVRFKYGPWDFRYRRLLNILVAKKLLHLSVRGRTVNIGITRRGREVAQALGNQPEFGELRLRSKLLKSYLNLSATTLMRFIYSTFPEIGDLRLGERINES